MLPPRSTRTGELSGAPPRRRVSGQVASRRSTLPVMCSFTPPAPLIGVTWRFGRMSPVEGAHGGMVVGGTLLGGTLPGGTLEAGGVLGLTVTVTAAVSQSACPAPLMMLSHRPYWNWSRPKNPASGVYSMMPSDRIWIVPWVGERCSTTIVA